MPARRFKTIVLLVVASVLILFYLTTGASSTRSSEFYSRTVAAVNARTHAHDSTIGGSKSFNDIAAANANIAKDKDSEMDGEIDRVVSGKETDSHDVKQKPLADDLADGTETVARKGKEAAAGVGAKAKAALEDADEAIEMGASKARANAAKAGDKVKDTVGKSKEMASDVEADIKEAIDPVTGGEKTVAGCKKYGPGDGKKVVKEGGDDNDGVAKVGNTGKKVNAGKGDGKDEESEEEEDHEVEAALDQILKRSPGMYKTQDPPTEWSIANDISQLSSSVRRTALTAKRQNTSCWTSTASCLLLTSRNWMSTTSARNSRLPCSK